MTLSQQKGEGRKHPIHNGHHCHHHHCRHPHHPHQQEHTEQDVGETPESTLNREGVTGIGRETNSGATVRICVTKPPTVSKRSSRPGKNRGDGRKAQKQILSYTKAYPLTKTAFFGLVGKNGLFKCQLKKLKLALNLTPYTTMNVRNQRSELTIKPREYQNKTRANIQILLGSSF